MARARLLGCEKPAAFGFRLRIVRAWRRSWPIGTARGSMPGGRGSCCSPPTGWARWRSCARRARPSPASGAGRHRCSAAPARSLVAQSGFRKRGLTVARHQLPPGPGRPRGSKNRFTLAVEDRLNAKGLDPIEFLAGVVLNDDGAWPADHRLRAAIELATYIAPKRKAVEHISDAVARPFVIFGAEPDATSAEWEKRNNPGVNDQFQ